MPSPPPTVPESPASGSESAAICLERPIQRLVPSDPRSLSRDGGGGGIRTRRLRTSSAVLLVQRRSELWLSIPVVIARVQPEPAVPDAVRTRHGPTPLRHGGSGPVWSRTPAALRIFATKDRSGRPGTVRPMSAVDLLRRWSLRALLAEGLREVGNALVADEDQRDDREGGRIPHRVLCAEKHAPVGPPAERAFEPGRVRRGFGDDRMAWC